MSAYLSSRRSAACLCARKHARSPSLGPRLTCGELATLPCHPPRPIQNAEYALASSGELVVAGWRRMASYVSVNRPCTIRATATAVAYRGRTLIWRFRRAGQGTYQGERAGTVLGHACGGTPLCGVAPAEGQGRGQRRGGCPAGHDEPAGQRRRDVVVRRVVVNQRFAGAAGQVDVGAVGQGGDERLGRVAPQYDRAGGERRVAEDDADRSPEQPAQCSGRGAAGAGRHGWRGRCSPGGGREPLGE